MNLRIASVSAMNKTKRWWSLGAVRNVLRVLIYPTEDSVVLLYL